LMPARRDRRRASGGGLNEPPQRSGVGAGLLQLLHHRLGADPLKHRPRLVPLAGEGENTILDPTTRYPSIVESVLELLDAFLLGIDDSLLLVALADYPTHFTFEERITLFRLVPFARYV